MCVDNGEHAYNFKQISFPAERHGQDNLLSFCATNCIADATANKEGLKHYVGFNSLEEEKACRCYYSHGFFNEDLTSDHEIGRGAIEKADGNIGESPYDCFKYKVR